MGRTLFLARLALGRSALQPLSASQQSTNEHADLYLSTRSGGERIGPSLHYQQFDSHGRPVNPVAEARKVVLRRAQNTVLALVGVLEGRDLGTPFTFPTQSSHLTSRRYSISIDQSLIMLYTIMHGATTWWLDMVVQARLATGLMSTSEAFSSSFLCGIEHCRKHGLAGFIEAFQPGFLSYTVYSLSRIVLCTITELGSGWIQERLIAKHTLTSRNARRLYALVNVCRISLLVVIDAALLPLSYFASVQALGLLPAFPMLPQWSQMLPWTPRNLQHNLWSSPVELSLVGVAFSPGALRLILSIAARSAFDFNSASLARLRPYRMIAPPFDHSYCVCGEHSSPHNHHVISSSRRHVEEALYTGHPHTAGYESVTLSAYERVRANFTGLVVNCPISIIRSRFNRWYMMPFINLTSRAITCSFLRSDAVLSVHSKPRTYVVSSLYAPFGDGPAGRLCCALRSSAQWLELWHYIQKLALCAAMQATATMAFLASRTMSV